MLPTESKDLRLLFVSALHSGYNAKRFSLKLRVDPTSIWLHKSCFVSGREFTRAASYAKSMWGFSPCGRSFAIFGLFRSLFNP